MRAAPTSGFNTAVANTCYVDSLGDFFNFIPGSTATDVSNVIVSSSDALGKWFRMWIGRQGVIDPGATLTAATTYTSPTWTAGLYRKIILELEVSCSAFSYFRFQANAVATSVYTDIGYNNNSAVANDSAVKGTNGFARVGVCIAAGNNNVMRTQFWPLTTGRTRLGLSESMSDNNSGTLANSMGRAVQFAFCDTTTDVTFITASVTGATMTGIAKLYGELA